MRSRIARVAAVIPAVAALTLVGCSSSGSDTSAADTDAPTSISVAALTPATNFDPLTNWTGPAYNYVVTAYETLVSLETDGSLTPGIATSWEYTSPTALTMDIRTDSVFSDGSDLDIDLVVANIERVRDTPSAVQSRMNSIDTITALDEDTIEFSLNTPDPSLPGAFSGASGMIVSQAALDDPDLMLTETAGSGPWMLTDSVAGSSYTYELNPEYTGSREVGFDVIQFEVISDLVAQLNALLAGDVDLGVAQWTQRETAEQNGMAGVGFAGNVGGIWLFDRDGEVVPALADVRVRQAINYAIDREALGNALWSSYQRPTAQVFSTQTSGYVEELDDYYAYDPERAQELMDEAGYADGFTMPVVSRATFGDNARLEATIPYLEAIGITVELVDRTNDYDDAIASGEFAAAQSQAGMNDSYVGMTSLLAENAALNPFGTTDPELTELIEAASAELDPEAAADLWQQVSTWVVEEAWFAPISYYETHNFYNPEVVTGVELTPGYAVSIPFTWEPVS
ncbi:ABC transporter substrate-binding protein [Microbacter sp. GSS18]|nr:ABC transporter substrate-binding protein [Microbacter sp. GSS18]